MASHLDCIGIDVADSGAIETFLEGALAAARVDAPGSMEHRHLLWLDPSGAALGLHLRGETLECLTPFFVAPDGPALWRARTTAAAADPDCEHCSGADCDLVDPAGEVLTRATVQWLHFLPWEQWLASPRNFELEVVAFAHRVAFCADQAAFEEAQREFWAEPGQPELMLDDGRPLRLSHTGFLPLGMFGPAEGSVGDRATALLAGPVGAHRACRNQTTGRGFEHVRIDTLPGPVDVVVAEESYAGDLSTGALALVEGWLVGRPHGRIPTSAPRTGMA
jgi:hypothetical protein